MESRFELLTEAQSALVAEERRLLGDLRDLLVQIDATSDDLATLRQAIQDLDELFLLVVVGEFNAGKSAFINALLGEPLLPEGVTPTTTAVQIIHYGQEASVREGDDGILRLTYPLDLLRRVRIVDTPGTNAVIRQHQEITERFVPRSDLVLFITSSDRPFTESERAFLEQIRAWGKKVVLVVNKADLLSAVDLEQVLAFIREQAQRLLGFTPEVFPISARQAQQARLLPLGEQRAQLRAASRLGELESYVRATLEDESRFRLKLLSPLGVGRRLLARYMEAAESRLQVLGADLQAVEGVDSQIALYAEDMQHDFRFHLSQVDNVIHETTARGRRFFEETVRIARVLDLLNSDRIRGEFERTVVADTSARIEDAVQSLVDWMVEREHRTWTAIADYLRLRLAAREEELVGRVGGSFAHDRRQLLETVGREARRAVDTYDPQAEARELALSVRTSVAQAALVEAGAVSLGAAVTIALGSLVADVTGLIAASVLAVIGFYVLPARRQRAQREFETKMQALRDRLIETLRSQFERELDRSALQLREAVAPYTRFVRAERDKIDSARQALDALQGRLDALARRADTGATGSGQPGNRMP